MQISESKRAAILRAIHGGDATLSEIADALGVGRSTIRSMAKEEGLSLLGRGIIPSMRSKRPSRAARSKDVDNTDSAGVHPRPE